MNLPFYVVSRRDDLFFASTVSNGKLYDICARTPENLVEELIRLSKIRHCVFRPCSGIYTGPPESSNSQKEIRFLNPQEHSEFWIEFHNSVAFPKQPSYSLN